MFSFNALLKLIRSLSIHGLLVKVSTTISIYKLSFIFSNINFCMLSNIAWEFFFQFPKMTWIFFSFVLLLCFISFNFVSTFLLLNNAACNIFCQNEICDKPPDSKLYHGEKYLVTESMINTFTWQMNLTVRNLHKSDFGQYVCMSENALGKSDARIRLQGKHAKLIKRQENYFSPPFTSNSLIYGITIVSSSFSVSVWYTLFLFILLLFNAKTFLLTLYCYCSYCLLYFVHDAIWIIMKWLLKNGNTELLLPKKPTTTPTPYIYTTIKPQRSRNKQQQQQQQHNHQQHKTQHEGKIAKEIIAGPNQIQANRESEAVVIAGVEGKSVTLSSYQYFLLSWIWNYAFLEVRNENGVKIVQHVNLRTGRGKLSKCKFLII